MGCSGSAEPSRSRQQRFPEIRCRLLLRTEGPPISCAVSPDGSLVASVTDSEGPRSGKPPAIVLWDGKTGSKLVDLTGHSAARANEIAIGTHQNTHTVACASEDAAWLWPNVGSPTSSAGAIELSTDSAASAVCLSFSSCGMLLVVGYSDGGVRVWSVSEGVCREDWKAASSVHSCRFLQEDTHVFVVTDEEISVWARQGVSTAPDMVHQVSRQSGLVINNLDSTALLITNQYTTLHCRRGLIDVHVFDQPNELEYQHDVFEVVSVKGEPLVPVEWADILGGPAGFATCGSFSPASPLAAFGTTVGEVFVTSDVHAPPVSRRIVSRNENTPGGLSLESGHCDAVICCAFSSCGDTLVTASKDHSVRVFSVASPSGASGE